MARMSSLRHLQRALLYYGGAVLFALGLEAQTITPQGGETLLIEENSRRGDQTVPHLSLTASGGYVVWQDNSIDGSGFGIGARWVDSSLGPGVFGSFRVNQQGAEDQVHPQVAAFSNGAAAFVWQGGPATNQNIFIRFLNPNRTFSTANDIRVNVYTARPQWDPAVAALSDSQAVVVWGSSGQDGSMQGVFARIVNTNGQFAAAPFQVNQYTNFNQRSPAVAVLENGSFAVVWVSEQRVAASPDATYGGRYVDLMGRVYSNSGQALTSEFRINTANGVCGNPSVAKSGSGFAAAWAQKIFRDTNSWDIYVSTLNADGSAAASPVLVNEYVYGDQFSPSISTISNNQFVVWTSLGQDGSLEGVFGRLLYNGSPSGSEFLVNTTVNNEQMLPVVGSDGSARFLVCWAGFTGLSNRFDLFGQRYASGQPLPVPAAPFVSALGSARLSVTWPPLVGYPLSYYEIYLDGAVPPAASARVTNSTYWVKSGLDPESTHSFQLAYVFEGAIRSQLSPPGSAKTWGEDLTGAEALPDGLPDDWQRMYWGTKPGFWPAPSVDSDGDGVSNIREFLAGTDPTNANSVLKMWFTWNRFGRRLNWNTVPGFIYQVQSSSDLATWNNFGAPRFSAATTDSTSVTGAAGAEYYRVLRVR
jgi:hypothetical protein